MNHSLSTPVLLLIYNRPRPTSLVFEAIRRAKPARLFIAANGPLHGSDTDKDLCGAARQVVAQVDWPCQVKTLFRDQHVSVPQAVEESVTWFFDQVEEGIIVDDDNLPMPEFFPFCEQMLVRYRDDLRVMHVAGTNVMADQPSDPDNQDFSYYFSRYANVRGWATWKRAWAKHRFQPETYAELRNLGMFDRSFFDQGERDYWLEKFDKLVNNSREHWQHGWTFALWTQSGLCIVPNANLVSRADPENPRDTPRRKLTFPLRHPDMIIRDLRSDRKYYEKEIRPRLPVAARLRGLLANFLH